MSHRPTSPHEAHLGPGFAGSRFVSAFGGSRFFWNPQAWRGASWSRGLNACLGMEGPGLSLSGSWSFLPALGSPPVLSNPQLVSCHGHRCWGLLVAWRRGPPPDHSFVPWTPPLPHVPPSAALSGHSLSRPPRLPSSLPSVLPAPDYVLGRNPSGRVGP